MPLIKKKHCSIKTKKFINDENEFLPEKYFFVTNFKPLEFL